jgi:hypothetical protein
MRPTTVVSQPRRLATSAVSVRPSRSQASWTASSASAVEPSIRKATARRCGRLASNRSASKFLSSIGHIPASRFVMGMTDEAMPM